jgi:3-deoxy-7-phosphoheptulonate synthase
LLSLARAETGLAVVTEVVDRESVDSVAEHADILQIGARNMQNYSLLKAAGRAGRPVLLKRGMGATVEELLLAAEYVLVEGESRVILCERGVRGFDSHARNLLDLAAIPSVKELSHLPIIVDPSHGTGSRSKVPAMARAAVAAGADGVMIEVHPRPAEAVSDGAQSLTPGQFETLVVELRAIARAVGRDLADPVVAAAIGA